MPPKVLHAIRTVDARQTGGAEELLLLLGPALRNGGRFDPAIMLLRKPDPTADPSKDFGERARMLGLDVLPLQQMRMRPGWLRAMPRRSGVSLIHMHGQRANYFVWLMRRLFPRAWGGIPLVATVHGWVQDSFVRKVVTRLEFATLRDCDHVITVSEQQRRTLLNKGFSPDRVSVVRPGIPYLASRESHIATEDERAAARAQWGIPNDAYVITAVGRLSTEKRFDLYLQMCAQLLHSIPDARFLLVGGGKQEAALRTLSTTLGLDNHLIFTGLTRDMRSVYAATDILALTSDTEGTPHVLLEAMGSSIPVISTSVGGIPEFITNEAQGLLVPAGDPTALAEAVFRIHNDKSLASHLIANGLTIASEFTVERMVAGVEAVYARVLRTPKGRKTKEELPVKNSKLRTQNSRKVRLLQLIDHLGNGGAERLQVTFASGIDRTRFNLHVCAMRPAPGLSVGPEIRALGVPVSELNQRNAYDIPALISLVRLIRRHRIDIIHTHLLASDVMGRVAGFITRRPVVSTIHNSRADLDAEPSRRQWLEKWTARLMARRLIVVSELLQEEIASWFGVLQKRVVTIPNGVEIERFARDASFDQASVRRELLGGDYPMVINVARWTPQKDQKTLVEAARIVIDKRPDVRFLLVGHGPLHDDLVAQAASLGIADKVVFAGFRDDIADLLAASDLFVLSSLWEGMPLALLEAMAAGCPSVCTDVGGVAQVLQHDVTGLLVPPADPPALAAAILRYLNDPQMRQQHGEAGLRWVRQHYSMQAWAKKLERLYLRELRRLT